jgi:predicted RNA binding protein YcfA (HicA-like mRNA interferase family)
MSRKLRVLSGKEVVKIIERYCFAQTRSVGSHVRMTCKINGETFHITIPLHNELKRGTLSDIVSELERCVSREELEKDFYTK